MIRYRVRATDAAAAASALWREPITPVTVEKISPWEENIVELCMVFYMVCGIFLMAFSR